MKGQRLIIANNKLLDKFIMEGITLKPHGEAKIDVTFEIDKNGILIVSGSEIGTSFIMKLRL